MSFRRSLYQHRIRIVAFTTLAVCLWPLPSRAVPVGVDTLPALEKEILIRAGVDLVWRTWTTEDGIRFLSPDSNIDLVPGGAYELFLNLPPDELGRRGAEGSRVLTVLPRELLAFDWTFPPSLARLRREGARTHVVVLFEPVGEHVRLRLVQYGWGDGPEWRAGYEYFDEAWGQVLSAMKAHLEADNAPAVRASPPRARPGDPPLAPLDLLAGQTWHAQGTGYRTTLSYHWLSEGRVLEARNEVFGASGNLIARYWGTYAWDAGREEIVFWTVAEGGEVHRGRAWWSDGVLWHEAEVSGGGIEAYASAMRPAGAGDRLEYFAAYGSRRAGPELLKTEPIVYAPLAP